MGESVKSETSQTVSLSNYGRAEVRRKAGKNRVVSRSGTRTPEQEIHSCQSPKATLEPHACMHTAQLINFPPQKRSGLEPLEPSIVSYRSVRIIRTLGTIPVAEVQTTYSNKPIQQSDLSEHHSAEFLPICMYGPWSNRPLFPSRSSGSTLSGAGSGMSGANETNILFCCAGSWPSLRYLFHRHNKGLYSFVALLHCQELADFTPDHAMRHYCYHQ